MVSSSDAQSREILLTPLSHIYTELCYPTYYPTLSTHLAQVLRYHVPHLQSPGQPFAAPSSAHRTAVKAGKATFPRSALALDVHASLVDVVLAVSDSLAIDEFEALWLYQAFVRYVRDDELEVEGAGASASGSALKAEHDHLVEQITQWYFAEARAIPQLAAAVIRAALDDQHHYQEDARAVLAEILDGKPETYLKRLFGDFVAVGQKPFPKKDELTWAVHNLQLQSEIISTLFLSIYQNICQPTPASVTEGLFRGIISSNFGGALTVQPHLIEASHEASRLRHKIKDQLVLIAVDCLGLARLLDGDREVDGSIAFKGDVIYQLDTWLAGLDMGGGSGSGSGELEIVKLAWAALLRQLDPSCAPPSAGVPRYQIVATEVFQSSPSVLTSLQELLDGPLLAPPTEIEDEAELDGSLLRDTVKALLMATAELVNVEYLQDFDGYCQVWRSIFGKGSPEVSELLCNAFWQVDYNIESRRAVLDNARYPSQPTQLLTLLQSLCQSPDSAEYAFAYLADLAVVTLNLQSVDTALYETRISSEGARSYVATRPMRLPGGAVIPAGSSGLLIRGGAGGEGRTVQFEVPGIDFGWSILMEILTTVAGGTRPQEQDDVFAAEQQLSLADIGLEHAVTTARLDTVTSALDLIRSIVQFAPHLANELLQRLAPDTTDDDHELFQILFGILHQPADAVLREGVQAVRLVETAIGIIEALSAPLPGIVMVSLRNAAFFGTSTKSLGSATAYLRHEIRQGSYKLTIAVLGLIDTLIIQAAKLAHTDHARYMAELVLSAIRFVHVEVWSRYSSWKYLDIRQRFTIGLLSARIFSRVVGEPVFINPLGLLSAYLIDVFLVAASPVTVLPIATAVSSLQPLQQRLLNAKRVQDARAAKTSVVAVLNLAQSLLRLKIRVAPERQTLLEASFFDNAAAADRQRLRGKIELVDLVTGIAAGAAGSGDLEVAALELIKVLLDSTALTTPKPSLVGHFKNPAAAADRLVTVVRDAPADVAATAWQVLAAIVITQPGFAVLCVSGHRNHLDRSRAEPPSENSALAAAVAHVTDWNAGWEDPRLLSAVLGFCTAVWTNMADTAAVSYQNNETFWKSVVAIATAPLAAPPIASLYQASVEACELYSHRTQAKARATFLLSLEKAGQAKTQLLTLFRVKGQLLPAVAAAIASSCNPDLHASASSALGQLPLDLQQLRTLGERHYGVGYLYDMESINGLLSTLSEDLREEYLLRVQALNLSWSAIDAEIALVKAWRRLCEVSISRNDEMAARASFDVACVVAEEIASEKRQGEVMQAFQAERMIVLRVLLENAWDVDIAVQPILPHLRSIIKSETFSPLTSVRRHLQPAIHMSVFQITYLVLRRLSVEDIPFLHAALDLVTAASSELISLAVAGDFDESLELALAVLGQLTRAQLKLEPKIWLDKMSEYNLIARSMELIVSAPVIDESSPPYLRPVLNLHFTLAASPAAERLATSGLVGAYSNNAIAALAEEGGISPMSAEFAGARHPTHDIWCSMLLTLNATLGSMSASSAYHFCRAEIVPFIELCGGQISRCLEWDASQPLNTPIILELEQISLLFYSVAAALGDQADGVLATYATKAVAFLGNVQDALAHPNHLSSLLEPASQAERTQLDVERPEGDADLLEGRLLPAMVQALLRISQTVLSTLVLWTKSYDLMGDRLESWPKHLILQPSSASTSSDPIGIVTDLAATVIDLHRRMGGRAESPPQSTQVVPTFSPKTASSYTRRILEASAVLSSSQLVMRSGLAALAAESGELMKPIAGGSQDRGAQVLRELTSDLLSLLPRAQSVLEESYTRGADVIRAAEVFVGRNLIDRE